MLNEEYVFVFSRRYDLFKRFINAFEFFFFLLTSRLDGGIYITNGQTAASNDSLNTDKMFSFLNIITLSGYRVD